MNILLLDFQVLLLNLNQAPRIFDLVVVKASSAPVFPLHSLVVLLVVIYVLALKLLNGSFKILGFSALQVLLWQVLLRDISIVEVDTDMLVFHVEVASDSWVCHDFLKLLFISILDFIAIEHRDWSYVLERGL